ITEFGSPSYIPGKSELAAEEAQAKYLAAAWQDIQANSAGGGKTGNALGGAVFEWLDEWWKVQPHHPGGEMASALRQDAISIAPGPFPGGGFYEEHFGLASQGDGRHSPFQRILRPSYFAFRGLWTDAEALRPVTPEITPEKKTELETQLQKLSPQIEAAQAELEQLEKEKQALEAKLASQKALPVADTVAAIIEEAKKKAAKKEPLLEQEKQPAGVVDYRNQRVKVVSGVPMMADLPWSLTYKGTKTYTPLLPADPSAKGKHAEPTGKGWARTWFLVTDLDGNFISLNVLDILGKLSFILDGNVRVNGIPLDIDDPRISVVRDNQTGEKVLRIDGRAFDITKDLIHADFVTRIFRDNGSAIRSAIKGKDGFKILEFNPESHNPKLNLWLSDFEQIIFRGETIDGKYVIHEVRSYLKNSAGEILFLGDEPQYIGRIEYYNNEGESRFSVTYKDNELFRISRFIERYKNGNTRFEIVERTELVTVPAELKSPEGALGLTAGELENIFNKLQRKNPDAKTSEIYNIGYGQTEQRITEAFSADGQLEIRRIIDFYYTGVSKTPSRTILREEVRNHVQVAKSWLVSFTISGKEDEIHREFLLRAGLNNTQVDELLARVVKENLTLARIKERAAELGQGSLIVRTHQRNLLGWDLKRTLGNSTQYFIYDKFGANRAGVTVNKQGQLLSLSYADEQGLIHHLDLKSLEKAEAESVREQFADFVALIEQNNHILSAEQIKPLRDLINESNHRILKADYFGDITEETVGLRHIVYKVNAQVTHRLGVTAKDKELIEASFNLNTDTPWIISRIKAGTLTSKQQKYIHSLRNLAYLSEDNVKKLTELFTALQDKARAVFIDINHNEVFFIEKGRLSLPLRDALGRVPETRTYSLTQDKPADYIAQLSRILNNSANITEDIHNLSWTKRYSRIKESRTITLPNGVEVPLKQEREWSVAEDGTEKEGKVLRAFVVNEYGEEIVRFYPKAKEVEIVLSDTDSDIYTYDQRTDKLSDKPIAHVKSIAHINLPEDKGIAIVLQRTGVEPRIFGVDAYTGEEIIQFFTRPQTVNATKVRGLAVVDLGEDISKLPKAVRDKRGYSTEEPLKLKRLYYFDAERNILTKLGLQGYAVETNDKIQGHEENGWKVVEEITPDGEFKIARAVDALGDEQARISRLPEGEYSIDDIDYENDEISKITTYRGTKEQNLYKLGEKLSTFTVLRGNSLKIALDDFEAVRTSLPHLKPYGFDDSFQDVLNDLEQELGLEELRLYAGNLHQENNGNFVTYRIKEDYLARIIAQKNPDGTWQFNLAWDKKGQPKKSIIVWNGQIYASAQSSHKPITEILRSKKLYKKLEKAFIEAQKAGLYPAMSLTDYLSQFGISEGENTAIATSATNIYGKQGQITINPETEEITYDIKFNSNVEKRVQFYFIPNDPWGRILITRFDTSEGYDLVFNFYGKGQAQLLMAITFKINTGWWDTVKLRDISIRDESKANNTFISKLNGIELESEYTSWGRLARKQHPRVGHYFAEIPVMKKGIEETAYNTEAPLEIPLMAYHQGKKVKTWEKIEIDSRGDDNKYYVHTVREIHPLAPQKEQVLEYYYDKYGKFKGKRLISDPERLTQKTLLIILGSGIGAIVILFRILSFFGKWALRRKKNNLNSLIQRSKVKDEAELKQQLIDNLELVKREITGWIGLGLISNQELFRANNVIDTAINEINSAGTNNTLREGEKALVKVKAVEKVLLDLIFKLQNSLYGNQDEKRAFVRRVLRGWSFYVNLVNFDFETLRDLPGQGSEFRAFSRWLRHSGAQDKAIIEGFLKQYPLFSVIIFEVMEDEAEKYLRGDAGAVRYYLIYSFIHDLFNGVDKEALITNARGRRDGVLALFKKLKAPTKDQKITFEDLRYIFKTINGIQKFYNVAQDFNAGNISEKNVLRELKPRIGWFGTFKDTPVKAFIINLWMPIMLLTTAVVINLIPAIARIIFGMQLTIPTVGGSELLASLGFAIGFTLLMFGVTKILDKLNSASNDDIKKDYTEPLSDSKERVSTLPFWIFFGTALLAGAFANYWMLSWSLVVIKQVSSFGGWPIVTFGIPVGILAVIFAALTFYSFAYTLETVFAYYEGKKQGVGRIRNIRQSKKNFNQALERIRELSGSLGTENSREEFFRNLWEKFVDILRKQGDIDDDAKRYLLSWLNAQRVPKKGYFSEEAEERVKRFVEGWLMDLPPVLIWEYIMPTSVVSTAFNEPVWTPIEDLHKIHGKDDPEEGAEETILNYFIRKYRREWEIRVDDLDTSNSNKADLLTLSDLTQLSQDILNDPYLVT
ncbi:MAG: hypothetical protein NG712_03295, partial [Omnitrophica bacterium]|nr:hypothetical protein [Candidatus Omnitrophota bacterium]